MKYAHGRVFLVLLITKTSHDQLGTYALVHTQMQMLLYFEILTWLSILNVWSLALESALYLAYELDL